MVYKVFAKFTTITSSVNYFVDPLCYKLFFYMLSYTTLGRHRFKSIARRFFNPTVSKWTWTITTTKHRIRKSRFSKFYIATNSINNSKWYVTLAKWHWVNGNTSKNPDILDLPRRKENRRWRARNPSLGCQSS